MGEVKPACVVNKYKLQSTSYMKISFEKSYVSGQAILKKVLVKLKEQPQKFLAFFISQFFLRDL